jgi:hypothetical protein
MIAKMPKYVRVCPSVSVKKVCEELGIDYVESVPSMSKRSQQIIASSNQATVITSDGEHSFDVTEKEEVETDIHVHSTVTDLLVIPAPLSGAFKCNSLLQNGSIIFQDPLIFSAIRAFKSLVNLNRRSQYWTIETHARSGNITALLAQELSPRVFSFEESDIKIAALRDNFLRLNIPKSSKYSLTDYVIIINSFTDVEIIKSDFLLAKTKDKAFSKVRYAVCAPPTTSGAIVDRYQYFYEQGEYPFVKFTSGDKDFLQMLQLSALNHVSTGESFYLKRYL